MNRWKDEGIAGISQRLEKYGLRGGLEELFKICGFPMTHLVTDQCKGAAKDLKLVLAQEDVQRMLQSLPGTLQ